MRSKRTIFHLLFFLLASAPLLAQEEQDEIPADLPEGTVFNDSLEVVVDSTQMEVGIVDTKIHLLSRTYGDSIVLRTVPLMPTHWLTACAPTPWSSSASAIPPRTPSP